jgi:hypothetical protein
MMRKKYYLREFQFLFQVQRAVDHRIEAGWAGAKEIIYSCSLV